jgi:hypothetical protein
MAGMAGMVTTAAGLLGLATPGLCWSTNTISMQTPEANQVQSQRIHTEYTRQESK